MLENKAITEAKDTLIKYIRGYFQNVENKSVMGKIKIKH